LPPTSEEVESLKAKVSAAFDGVPRPPAGGVVRCDCWECAGVAKSFAGRGWREVGAEVLEENYHTLPLLSPAAFRHFLPAYLLYSLEHFELSGVCEYTLYALTPGKETGESAAFYAERFAPLSPEQMEVVYGFLDLARRDEAFAHHHTAIERGRKRLEKYSGSGARGRRPAPDG
jgi:hypothetical protein